MTKENKDLLQKLLWQHKELGISDQIDFDNFSKDIKSLLANEIVTRYYFQRGAIIQALKDDDDLRTAREVLADPTRYRTILKREK